MIFHSYVSLPEGRGTSSRITSLTPCLGLTFGGALTIQHLIDALQAYQQEHPNSQWPEVPKVQFLSEWEGNREIIGNLEAFWNENHRWKTCMRNLLHNSSYFYNFYIVYIYIYEDYIEKIWIEGCWNFMRGYVKRC